MKLVGDLKDKVEKAENLEEAKEIIKDAGMELTDEEMELLKKAERNCRLVKGQVFLWPGADDWKQLWE